MEPNKELEKAIESKFLTPQKFAMEIESIVAGGDFNYIDAIVHYCDSNNLEIESITKLISKPLKYSCDASVNLKLPNDMFKSQIIGFHCFALS